MSFRRPPNIIAETWRLVHRSRSRKIDIMSRCSFHEIKISSFPGREQPASVTKLARFAQDVQKRVTTRCKNINMPLIDPVTISSAGAQAPPPAKPSLPIELLPTDFARIFSQAHPAILLSAYYLRFPALVADPVPTLLNSLLPLAAVQIIYAATCLPAVGSNAKPAKKTKLNASKKPNDAPTAKAFVTPLPFQ
jgi:hypothetical protein